jgi:hypothetical protein
MFPWGSCNLGEFSLGQLGWGYHLIPFSKKLQLGWVFLLATWLGLSSIVFFLKEVATFGGI